eukprot:snap_masked-scaffold_13-processed-gene-5.12-mRNA-1 protein AED:1.00 eAED:1.00 QI:0/-1/0/0/-1/1/1/0/73
MCLIEFYLTQNKDTHRLNVCEILTRKHQTIQGGRLFSPRNPDTCFAPEAKEANTFVAKTIDIAVVPFLRDADS